MPDESEDQKRPPELDHLALLRALVEAHANLYGDPPSRRSIMWIRVAAGDVLQHPALTDLPPFDEALIEELHGQGLIDIDYHERSRSIVPTPAGRRVVEVYDRTRSDEPVADTTAFVAAVGSQAQAANKLAWPAVRPVLAALRDYWMSGGFSVDGIQMRALLVAVPSEQHGVFVATIRASVSDGYLEPTAAGLSISGIPAEVILTDHARVVLDGWPGAQPQDLAENLLAVLEERAEQETDPVRKSRLRQVGQTIREIGIPVIGEVLARVAAGAM
jgi:hypothetical protein